MEFQILFHLYKYKCLLYFLETTLDVSLLAKYNNGQVEREVVKKLGEDMESGIPSQSGHYLLREYIMMNILICNANRAGGITNITQQVFETAKLVEDEERYVFEVCLILFKMCKCKLN